MILMFEQFMAYNLWSYDLPSNSCIRVHMYTNSHEPVAILFKGS